MNLKAQLASKVSTVEAVDLGELTVYVRELSAKQRSTLFGKLQDESQKPNLPAWLVLYSACENDGKRLYADTEFEQVANLSASVVDAISKAASKLNGLSTDAIDEAKKDSEPSQN